MFHIKKYVAPQFEGDGPGMTLSESRLIFISNNMPFQSSFLQSIKIGTSFMDTPNKNKQV
jgi:hypothetical protein